MKNYFINLKPKYKTRQFIKDNKIQQTRLARKLGISKQLLQYYITTNKISHDMLNKIAEILKTERTKVIDNLNNNYIIEI
jgi:transcriptional regulator with XRE-family HTH domain